MIVKGYTNPQTSNVYNYFPSVIKLYPMLESLLKLGIYTLKRTTLKERKNHVVYVILLLSRWIYRIRIKYMDGFLRMCIYVYEAVRQWKEWTNMLGVNNTDTWQTTEKQNTFCYFKAHTYNCLQFCRCCCFLLVYACWLFVSMLFLIGLRVYPCI